MLWSGKFYVIISFMLVGVAIMAGCKKDPNEFGLGLQPKEEFLNGIFNDTLTLTTKLVKRDSILVADSLNMPSTMLLGSMMDQYFGATRVGMYLQYRTTGSADQAINFPDEEGYEPISMKLIMEYSGFYGKKETEQTLRVHQLVDSLKYQRYYSNNQVAYEAEPVLEYTYEPKPNDSIKEVNDDGDTVKMAPRLVLDLSQSDVMDQIFYSNYENLQEFKNSHKGFYIDAGEISQSNAGGLSYFNFASAQTKLKMVYAQIENGDTLNRKTYTFQITGLIPRFYHVEHDYSMASGELINQLNGTAGGGDKVFLQPLGGLKTRIELPHVLNLVKGKNIVVNKAELILQCSESDPLFDVPEQLSLAVALKGDTIAQTVDWISEGSEFFGGVKEGNSYRFRITRHIQQLLRTPQDEFLPGLSVSVYNGASRGNHVMINGPQASSGAMKLELIYTEVDDQ